MKRGTPIFNRGQTSKSLNTFVGLQGLGHNDGLDALDGMGGAWGDLWDTITTKTAEGTETVFTANVDNYVEEKTDFSDPVAPPPPPDDQVIIVEESGGFMETIKKHPMVAIAGVGILLKLLA